LVAQVPDADILVNNLGTAHPKSFFDLADSEWLDLFQLNVMSGVRAARHYVPQMVKRGWGRVVFISSESALNIPKTGVRWIFVGTQLRFASLDTARILEILRYLLRRRHQHQR
jgi:NAD(P)-dependent dehydrogenase (short-subunit alcohol dehydrogenase family)